MRHVSGSPSSTVHPLNRKLKTIRLLDVEPGRPGSPYGVVFAMLTLRLNQVMWLFPTHGAAKPKKAKCSTWMTSLAKSVLVSTLSVLSGLQEGLLRRRSALYLPDSKKSIDAWPQLQPILLSAIASQSTMFHEHDIRLCERWESLLNSCPHGHSSEVFCATGDDTPVELLIKVAGETSELKLALGIDIYPTDDTEQTRATRSVLPIEVVDGTYDRQAEAVRQALTKQITAQNLHTEEANIPPTPLPSAREAVPAWDTDPYASIRQLRELKSRGQ